MTFELTRIWICIAVHDLKHLEIGLNQENGVLSYSTWKLFIPLDGAYLPHLITLLIVAELALQLKNKLSCIDEDKNNASLKVHNVRAHHMFSQILQLRIYEFLFNKLYLFAFLRGIFDIKLWKKNANLIDTLCSPKKKAKRVPWKKIVDS